MRPRDRRVAIAAPDLFGVARTYRDEDFAGLLDRVIGDWLVLPTIYDMLEYRVPDHVGPAAIEALRRLHGREHLQKALGGIEVALAHCKGLSVREWIGIGSPRTTKQQDTPRAKGKAKRPRKK